jgi:hypothetical protein
MRLIDCGWSKTSRTRPDANVFVLIAEMVEYGAGVYIVELAPWISGSKVTAAQKAIKQRCTLSPHQTCHALFPYDIRHSVIRHAHINKDIAVRSMAGPVVL